MRLWHSAVVLVGVLAWGCSDSETPNPVNTGSSGQAGASGASGSSGSGGALTQDPKADNPTLGETTQVVPSEGTPQQYKDENGVSNNNLDVTRHDGKVFLALRNGKFHYASEDTRMYIFSSTDEVNWDFETKIELGTDVREPRLLSFNGRLFLYFAQLGVNQFEFTPKGMWMTEYKGPGNWTEPVKFYKPDEPYIPWRAKVIDGKAYLITYKNGQNIYYFNCAPMDIEFLTSDDGEAWHGVNPEQPVVSSGGGSETDFDFDDRGDLYAVIRNEGGEDTNDGPKFGSKICKAPKEDITKWDCVYDKKKYDSPKVFSYNGQIFLIGRRNVTDDGNFQQDLEGSCSIQAAKNGIAYHDTPKRTALWQIDRVTLEVRFMMDLPGTGDTCFPSTLNDLKDPSTFFVYNYSSPLDGPDLNWSDGQLGPTYIYRTVMTMK